MLKCYWWTWLHTFFCTADLSGPLTLLTVHPWKASSNNSLEFQRRDSFGSFQNAVCYPVAAPYHILSTALASLTPLRRKSLTAIIRAITIYYKSWDTQKHYLCTTIFFLTAQESTFSWPWNHNHFYLKLFLHGCFLAQHLPCAAQHAFWSPLAYSHGMPATIAE